MFDEYFKPPPNVDHPVPKVPTPVPAASTSSHSSTTVDQDAPLTSTSQTTSEQQSSVIPQGVEDEFYDIEVANMDNDPYFAASDVAPTSAPVSAGQRRSTVAVNDGRRWRTTVDCRWTTVDHHRSTVVGGLVNDRVWVGSGSGPPRGMPRVSHVCTRVPTWHTRGS
nr:hypothetical protein [Tanacetum cinerariifolium]